MSVGHTLSCICQFLAPEDLVPTFECYWEGERLRANAAGLATVQIHPAKVARAKPITHMSTALALVVNTILSTEAARARAQL